MIRRQNISSPPNLHSTTEKALGDRSGFVALLTGSSRLAILSLVLLFAAGGLLLRLVKVPAVRGGESA